MPEYRLLQKQDDRSAFTSGDVELDRFFRLYAGQNQFRHQLGVSHVAVEGARILGYLTLAPGQVEVEALPEAQSHRWPAYPLPILRISRLAVAQEAQGQGVGAGLLARAFQVALELAPQVGCMGLVVDAKPGAEGWYRRFGFEAMRLLAGESGSRPAPTPMFLALAVVRAARRGAQPGGLGGA